MSRKLSVVLLGLFVSFATFLIAQDQMTQKDTDKKTMGSETVTGCLQKGDEPKGFTITGEDGKVWELRSTKINLSEHVGHKVTVMGSDVKAAESTEKKIGQSETKEAGGKEHGDLKVSSLKMVGTSCQ